MADLRNISFVLSLYARTLAADGYSRASLENSLAIRRLARHIGDDSIFTYLASLAIDRRSLLDIKYVLGVIPPDTGTLIWLKEQLAATRGVSNSFIKALKSQSRHALNTLRNNPNKYKLWRRNLSILAGLPYDDNEVKDLPKILVKDAAKLKEKFREINITDHEKNEIRKLLNLTNEQLLECSHRSYERWLNSVIRLLKSDIPYEKKYAELVLMEAKITQETDDPNNLFYYFDPNEIFLSHTYPDITRLYGLQTQYRAELNALKAAIDIYRIRAATGQLPDSLPDGLHEDLFSGKDFEYEITDSGFILRCRARDLEASRMKIRPGQPPEIISEKIQQYEFKVKK